MHWYFSPVAQKSAKTPTYWQQTKLKPHVVEAQDVLNTSPLGLGSGWKLALAEVISASFCTLLQPK